MPNFGRFAVLAVAFTFAQLSLAGALVQHASQDAGGGAAMAHMAMPPAEAELHQAPVQDDTGCHHCTTPAEGAPQCDHSTELGCMSMSSCGAASAEVASGTFNVSATAMRGITTPVLVPASPSLSQDTPPPRV